MDLAVGIYKTTDKYPPEEKFGLISQMRRCVISIPSNIAEGAARQSKKEFVHFLYISMGSLSELDTQLELSKRFGYIDEPTWRHFDNKLSEENKLISGLIRSQKTQ